MALWVAVHGLQDGEDVVFDVLNRPVFELTERTNYLYEQLAQLRGSSAFESIRITDAPVLTSGPDAPVVGDFVYLDADTNLYTRARASVDVASLATNNSSLAVGMVMSLHMGRATIVLYGKEPLGMDAPWDLNELVQPGEAFRPGPYYLSSHYPGKMTAYTSGVAIYLGYFVEDQDNPGYGGYCLLSPQYKDLEFAHLHRAVPLHAQPAGTQYVSGNTPIDTHTIRGFMPTLADQADRQPGLVVTGTWTGGGDIEYTFWLSNSSDANQTLGGTQPPVGDNWSDCYLHWKSSDESEGSGVIPVRSFDMVFPVGSKGLEVSLENPTGTQWDRPYYSSEDEEDKRKWVISVPEQTRGWLARKYRHVMNQIGVDAHDYTIVLRGGPLDNPEGRLWDNITMKCGELRRFTYSDQPEPGDTIVVGVTTFEFTTTGVPASPTNQLVPFGVDADETYRNLVKRVVDTLLASGYDAAINVDASHVLLLIPDAQAVDVSQLTNVSALVAISGPGMIAAGTADVMVYDEYHNALVENSSYWEMSYYIPATLRNGLQLIAVPYTTGGASVDAADSVVNSGDYWQVQVRDEAPGSKFVYAIGMHTSLLGHYPPVPMNAAVLVLNGIELTNYDQFPQNATYRLGPTSIYWYSDTLQSVPWPADWASTLVPGSPHLRQNMLMHFIKMSAGEAGLVTSLRPAPNSPIKVLQCGTGDPGTVGDLALDVDLEITEEDAGLGGFEVFKRVSGQKLRKGPVVERIISTDGSVTIGSSIGAPAGQGIVNLTVGGQTYGGEFEEVALQNAKQELIGMFPYIRLMGWNSDVTTNIPSGFVAKFRVPHDIGNPADPPKFRVAVYMTVFGEEDIPYIPGGRVLLAGIDFSYSILPDFHAITRPQAWPEGVAWNSLHKPLPGGLIEPTNPQHAEIRIGRYSVQNPNNVPTYTAYDPMLIHNNNAEPTQDEDRRIQRVLGAQPFPVRSQITNWPEEADDPVVLPGSLVGIRVDRRGVGNAEHEYKGSLGFINLRWKLIPVAGGVS